MEKFKVLAFDVDGTLVKDGQRPTEMVKLLAILARAVPLALVSGSSYQALEKKIVNDLVREGVSFEVYASGGAVHLSYQGNLPIYDSQHGADIHIPKSDISIVRTVVEEAARNSRNWGDDTSEVDRVANAYRFWAKERGEGYVWSHPQKWSIKVTNPGSVDSNSAIRVEARRNPTGERVVALSVKSIPRELDGIAVKFRDRLTDKLRQALQNHYQVLPAGHASVDVNLGNGTKALAIGHLAQSLNIGPQDILYFGDEFGVQGNDRAVLNAGVNNIVDVSSGGPELTVSCLKDLLDRR